MASTGATNGGTFATDGIDGPAWSAPSNAQTSNNIHTTALMATSPSEGLAATNFGFDSVIASDAVIDGVEVSVERSNVSATVQDHTVQLIVGGSYVGNNKADTATNWPSSDGSVTYGGATDTWGVSLAASDVRASNFGVVVKAKGTGTFARVDHITINVHYTPAAGGQPITKRHGAVPFVALPGRGNVF